MDPNRKKLLLISVVIIFIALRVASSIFRSQAARSQKLKARVAEERDKNRALAGIGKVEKEIASYQPRIVPERNDEWLRRSVTDMAGQSRVEIVSISPQAPDDKGVYVRLPLRLEVECEYHQLGDFISKMESSEKFIKVDALNRGVIGTKEGRTIARVSLTISTFYLKD